MTTIFSKFHWENGLPHVFIDLQHIAHDTA